MSGLRCETFQLRNLWQAVIRQAGLDLRGAVGHRSAVERDDGIARATEAAEWMRGDCCRGTNHFTEVCDLAGVDPALMRERLLRGAPPAKRPKIEEDYWASPASEVEHPCSSMLEQSEPPQDTEQPSTSPTPGFPDAPCVSYDPAIMESADTQTACAN